MRKIHASYVTDGSGSIVRDLVIIVSDEAIIEAVGGLSEYSSEETEHYEGLLCPGFINAHCHLELSYLKDKIPPQEGLLNFIEHIFTLRNDSDPGTVPAMTIAEQEMWNEGIVAAGDISNDLVSFDIKAGSRLRYYTFAECFGLDAAKTDDYFQHSKKIMNEAIGRKLSASMSPHAPYSTSTELLNKILSPSENKTEIFTYHNQESEEENKLFRGEKSDFNSFYQAFHFQPPNRKGASSIRAHLPLFPKNANLLFVHNTFISKEDIDWAMNEHPHLYFCFCPSANLYIESALPDFENFLSYADRLCIGTDSLASNDSLSVLKELKIIQHKNPSIPTAELIRLATKNAATFFGWNDLGSIKPGMKPGLNLISGLDRDLKFTKESAVMKLL